MMLFALSTESENETKTAEQQTSEETTLTEEERQLQEDYRRFGIEGEEEVSMDSIADMLSTFQDEEENAEKKPEKANRRSDISKKKRLIPSSPLVRSSV